MTRWFIRFALLLSTIFLAAPAVSLAAVPPSIATFSVVAYNPSTGEVGVAVQSKFFAVGSVVPYCKAGVGAVATQAFGQPDFGPQGLEELGPNLAREVITALLASDEKRAQRQIGMVGVFQSEDRYSSTYFPSFYPEEETPKVDSVDTPTGDAATYTGKECLNWAGGKPGVSSDGVIYAVQGNILAGPEVLEAMAAAMDNPGGIVLPGAYANGQVGIALNTQDFAGRLLAALVAGQVAGGDSRGMQSAALKVSQKGAGYGGYNDVKYDLRVDDAVDPFIELARLLNLARPIALTNQGYTLLNSGSIEQAIVVFTDLATLQPGDANHRYNLACGLARSGRGDEAVEQLRTALKLDPKLREPAKSDTDLESLRERADFKELVFQDLSL